MRKKFHLLLQQERALLTYLKPQEQSRRFQEIQSVSHQRVELSLLQMMSRRLLVSQSSVWNQSLYRVMLFLVLPRKQVPWSERIGSCNMNVHATSFSVLNCVARHCSCWHFPAEYFRYGCPWDAEFLAVLSHTVIKLWYTVYQYVSLSIYCASVSHSVLWHVGFQALKSFWTPKRWFFFFIFLLFLLFFMWFFFHDIWLKAMQEWIDEHSKRNTSCVFCVSLSTVSFSQISRTATHEQYYWWGRRSIK